MDALIVVDMQVGLLNGPPKHDLSGVVQRINTLAKAVRQRGGKVIWIRHCGPPGDDFAPDAPGWLFLPELDRQSSDVVVDKTLNDPFARTDLQATLLRLGVDRVVVTGWATDFCVDSTVRSAVSHDYDVVVVGDGHTLNDRPHLDAPAVIGHHNWVWADLITRRSIHVVRAAQLIEDHQEDTA